MNFPKIVAMYRVKNEERWIEKSIQSILDICSTIVVLDDGSSDSTLEICKSFDNVIIQSQSNLPFDEARDRNIILKMAMKEKPDYVFEIDGDEILASNSYDIFFDELTVLYPNIDVFELQFLYMWDKPNQIRYDGIFSRTWQKRLVNLKNQTELMFENTPYPGNMHSGFSSTNTVGYDRSVPSKVKILHYGNYDQKIREEKFEFYNKIDPNNKLTDEYRHIVSDDSKLSGKEGLVYKFLTDGVFYPNL